MMDEICTAIAEDLLSVEGVTSSEPADIPKATKEDAAQGVGAVSLLVGSGDRAVISRGINLDMVIVLSVLIIIDETQSPITSNTLIEGLTSRLARRPNWAGFTGRIGQTFSCPTVEVEGGQIIPVVSWAHAFRLVGDPNDGISLPDPEEFFNVQTLVS